MRQQLLLLLRWSLTYSIAGQVEHPDVGVQSKYWCLCRLTSKQRLQMGGQAVPFGAPAGFQTHWPYSSGVQPSMLPGVTIRFQGGQP